MDPITQRWTAYEKDRRLDAPAPYDPTAGPNCTGALRVRREYNARDAINSRAWDFFHATPATAVSADGLRNKDGPVHMDMNPIASRTNSVQYRLQPEYIPDPPRGAMTSESLGVPPASGAVVAPPTSFSQTPYLQRLDAAGSDGRNIIREMRSAVVEDNREREVDSTRRLTERQFTDRWLPPKAATDAQSLQAYELLRPKQDDWRSS